jgi:hypothetical protein
MKKPKDPPAHLRHLYEHAQGRGISKRFSDRAFWLRSNDSVEADWVDALHAVDNNKDIGPLLNLLGRCVPEQVLPYLKDLFERRGLSGRRSRRHPLYSRTPREIEIKSACDMVRRYVQHERLSVAAALERTAQETGIEEDTLANAYNKKRTSARRRPLRG